MSDQFNPLEFRSFENFYSYDYELYDKRFPKDWIIEMEKDQTGPKNCRNCANFGCWRGVFVSYCCNCAQDYSGERGPGFISHGIEMSTHNSIFAEGNYMHGVNLSEIGLIDFNPEHTLDDNGDPDYPVDLVRGEDGVYHFDDELFLASRKDYIHYDYEECLESDDEDEQGYYKQGYYKQEQQEQEQQGYSKQEQEYYKQEVNRCPGCYPIFEPGQLAHCVENGCLSDYILD